MHFLITFDLPKLDYPQRQFERPSLTDGRLQAKRMATVLWMHQQLPVKPEYFLYVWSGSGWVPNDLVIEHKLGYCMPGWRANLPWEEELPAELLHLAWEGSSCGFFWK